jgi:hypothetical protein
MTFHQLCMANLQILEHFVDFAACQDGCAQEEAVLVAVVRLQFSETLDTQLNLSAQVDETGVRNGIDSNAS